LTSGGREPKFAWGEPVSNHPLWVWQGAAGVALAALVFAAAFAPWRQTWREKRPDLPAPLLAGLAVDALAAGIAAPWAIANATTESLGAGGWVRGLAFIAVSLGAPIVVAMTLSREIAIPSFARVLGQTVHRPGSGLAVAAGAILIAVTVLALQTALGLVFDPRYRDFTFAPLTAAVVPFAVASVVGVRGLARLGRAERLAAVTLLGSAVYIVLNESVANWQAVWFATMLAVLAVTLFRLRDVQST
jgi:glucan 1,3-beta-glucosidase